MPPRATSGSTAACLRAGKFASGIVQHEYAHQGAFFAFGKADRARLQRELGGKDWYYENAGVAHDDHVCERFAHTLSWVYWSSNANVDKGKAAMARPRSSARS